jgi:hypothetical protein
MSRHGLLFKPLRNGFLLLYDTGMAGKNRVREALLKEKISLLFDVALKDTLFYNYTAVNAPGIADSIFVFSNTQPRVSAETLHQDVFVSSQDLQPSSSLRDRRLVKPFGQIALLLDEQLLPSYYISFQAKATRWCYFLMSEGLKALPHPAVLGTNGNGHFNIPVMITLPDTISVPVLISKEPLPLVQAAAQVFQLVDYVTEDADRYKVIIPALPVPDVSRVSAAAASLYESGNNYSEIFLY